MSDSSAAKKLFPCPKCKGEVEDLLKVDAGMKLALEQSGNKEKVFVQVCPTCYTELSTLVAQGARLRAQKNKSEFNKKTLWKNRVTFLKQARNLMSIRAYPESAKMYEKYIQSVAIGFEKKPTELTPDLFKDPRHRKELTIITYVFWDLFKIYDVSERSADKQAFFAKKLVEFALFNPNIQSDIARKLKNFSRFSRNRPLTNNTLKEVDKTLVRCFIATAAFSGHEAVEVKILCAFRDQILIKSFLGRIFIQTYYFISPSIARKLDIFPSVKSPIRYILRKIAMRLNQIFQLL